MVNINGQGEKMKYFKAYIITLVIGILVVSFLTLDARDEENTLTNARLRDYGGYWTVTSKAGEEFYEELPDSISRKGEEKIVLKKYLPQKIQDGDAVAFYTGHNIIHAYVDEELIYTFDVPKAYQNKSKTPGITWSFINLSSEYSGKILKIEMEPVYDGDVQQLPAFIYGDRAKIVIEIISDRAVALIFSALLFCVGGAVMLCMLCFKERLHAPDYMYWLGIFALVTAVWSFLQTHLMGLIYAQNLRGNQILFIVFQILLIPLVSFVKNLCHEKESRVYDLICIGNVVILVLTTVLQFAGIRDYRETVWLPYLDYLVGAIWMVVISIKAAHRREGQKMKIQCVGVIVLVFFIGVDMVNYLQEDSIDCARLSRIFLLIYTVVQICFVFENSIKLIHLGEQYEKVSREALHDALTKLSNRTAFEKDLSGYEVKPGCGAAMFDLNNLKYFNDVHGHAMGDYYIIVCSEIIQDIFGSHGNVYRIGGDEFCAVLNSIDEEKFEELRRKMNDRIESLNGRFFENKMSVASGYADYDGEVDQSIHDTVKRADEKMYECKTAMKQT